jgi:hypothetical protein
LARFYEVDYATGNAYAGNDRGENQPYASFLTNPVSYESADQETQVIFTSDNTTTVVPVQGGTKTTVKDWKENDRPRQ